MNKQQIKQILDDAPEDFTGYFNNRGSDLYTIYSKELCQWVVATREKETGHLDSIDFPIGWHSLSDLRAQLELIEENERLVERVGKLESYDAKVATLIQKCFGSNPVACDGALIVNCNNYNELVELFNSINKDAKQ